MHYSFEIAKLKKNNKKKIIKLGEIICDSIDFFMNKSAMISPNIQVEKKGRKLLNSHNKNTSKAEDYVSQITK